MFYITAHTVTQNQFANGNNDVQRPIIDTCTVCVDIPIVHQTTSKRNVNNKIPIILLPSDLKSVNHLKLLEKNAELHQTFASYGLRYDIFYILYIPNDRN